MTQPIFGQTRTHVATNHALVAPDGHVVSPMHGWQNAEGVVLVSPAMRGPRFVQCLVNGGEGTCTNGAAAGVERLVYVLSGVAQLDGNAFGMDSFAWFPPSDEYELSVPLGSKLLVFEKPYEQLENVEVPKRVVGHLSEATTEPFLGNTATMLATLLPIDPGFDMAVNVFHFDSGAALPFVETHVMEHGLYMNAGQGIYRLGDCWYPVQQGDAIWMASYCPQWFVAMGGGPAAYIYYKDIHRDPLAIHEASRLQFTQRPTDP